MAVSFQTWCLIALWLVSTSQGEMPIATLAHIKSMYSEGSGSLFGDSESIDDLTLEEYIAEARGGPMRRVAGLKSSPAREVDDEDAMWFDAESLRKIEPSDQSRLGSQKFIRELGVLFEPNNDVVMYDGYNYIPIIHHVPSFRSLLRSHLKCNHSILSDEIVKSYQRYLNRILPNLSGDSLHHSYFTAQARVSVNRTIGRREKRFLGALLGILGGGFSIWNRVSVSNLQSEVADLSTYISQNRDQLDKISSEVIHLADQGGQIARTVNSLIRYISEYRKNASCEVEELRFLSSTMETLVTAIPVGFVRAAEWALQGKVSPDLVPMKDLKKIIECHKELTGTVYQFVPALVYELGSFLVTEISKSPSLISGVMILPRIKRGYHSRSFTVGAVSYKFSGHVRKISPPSQIVVDEARKMAWSIDPVECRVGPTLITCPSSVPHRRVNQCVSSIFFQNSTLGCRVRAKRPGIDRSDIVQFQSGVLIGVSSPPWKIIKINNDREVNIGLTTKQHDSPVFVSSLDGDHVLCDDQVYPLILHREEVYEEVLHLNVTWEYDVNEIDINELKEQWRDLSALVPLERIPHWKSPIWQYVALGISLILTLGSIMYVRFRLNRGIAKQDEKLTALGDRLGLVPVKTRASAPMPPL